MEIELLDPATADLEELASLQRESFKGVTGTTAMDVLMQSLHSAEHYRRKYQAPAGKARIVAIRESGELLAMNAIVPELLRHASGAALGWQSCDTATHPKGRGRGLFKTCVKTLTEQLEEGEVLFGYPNANSLPGFAKFGWHTRAVLDAYVAPLPGMSDDEAIQQIAHFDVRHDRFAQQLAEDGKVCIDRSAAYLNWRYFRTEESPYAAFAYRNGDDIEGYAVVRRLPMRGRHVGVVMEIFAKLPEVESALLRAASRWGWREDAWPTFVFSNCWGERTWLKRGFIRLPRRLSPRQLVLMGSGIGDAGRRVFELEWRAFVGDWDVF